MAEEKSGKPKRQEESTKLETIRIHYIKSNLFRVVYAHGMWGGPTPHGDITISLFNERSPIPQQMDFKVNENGTLGEELSRVSKEGVIREVEIELVMSTSTAETFYSWLGDKINAAKKVQAAIQKKQGK